MKCFVAGCRYSETHVTLGHRCGTCGMYGHGQVECGNLLLTSNLRARDGDVMSPAWQCQEEGCRYAWSHSTLSHYCSLCRQRGGGCGCRSVSLHKSCPICREVSKVDTQNFIYADSECCVCMEKKPLVIFPACKHAPACKECVLRLE